MRLKELIAKRELSCMEVVRSHLDRIATLNPGLNAIVSVDESRALSDARAIDQAIAEGKQPGLLAGVPMTVKDLYEVAGIPSTSGTRGRTGFIPSVDATVVERLRRAGAIVIGKSNVPEFGMCLETTNDVFGTTNNPYDVARSPGGSSGGAVASVASGFAALEIGSDGGGSIRMPCHFCGVAGFKATTHRVSKAGHFPVPTGIASRLAGYGPIARSILDVAAAFEVILGSDPRDPDALPASVDVGRVPAMTGLRVGVFTDNGIRAPSAEISQAVERCAAILEGGGARVLEKRPPRMDDAFEIHLGLLIVDRCLIDDWKAAAGTEVLHAWVQAGVEYLADAAADFDANTATMLHDDWDAYRRDARLFMQDFDVLIGPVAPGAALPHGELSSADNYDWCSYASLYNVTGWPAAVIRAGTSADGLPIGVQIAGAAFSDRLVLEVAAFLEREIGGFVPPNLARD